MGGTHRQWRTGRLHRTREEACEARVDVLGWRFRDSGDRRLQRNTGWGSGDADSIRFGLSCGLRLAAWLERGSDRCSRVRSPGGAALNCWGGGAAETTSSGMADYRPVTKPESTERG